MIEKLEAIKQRWLELGEQLATPEVLNDHRKAAKISKKYKDLQVIVDAYEPYRGVMANIDENREILKTDPDPDFRDMAKVELEELLVQQTEMEEHLRNLLIPEDPEDSKSAILEIRAGTGGDEAAIFAGDLFRMYSRYCDRRGWKMIGLSINESSAGGYKELILEVTGEGAYGDLKYESGVHRVQRVPDTESQGRVHTSAATVAVLPEADDDVAIEINETDLKIDTFRASGAGGQHVNKTESAIRITHMPSGIVVGCQMERSQMQNREVAMQMLRTKLYEAEVQKRHDVTASRRRTLVSTGDRSAKIRTYNYPQGRMTDHRIGLTIYNLAAIMDGDIQEIINQLQIAENAEKLKAGEDFDLD